MWLIYESTKALEIKTSMVFNLIFVKILLYHASSSFPKLLTYVLIHAVIAQIFNPTAKFKMPTRILIKKTKAKI